MNFDPRIHFILVPKKEKKMAIQAACDKFVMMALKRLPYDKVFPCTEEGSVTLTLAHASDAPSQRLTRGAAAESRSV